MTKPAAGQPSPAPPGWEKLRQTLLPPLRFAAQHDFAKVERLKGLESLVARTLEGLSDVPRPLVQQLREASQGFDTMPAPARRQRVQALLALLMGAPPADAHTTLGRASGASASPAATPAQDTTPETRAIRSRAQEPRAMPKGPVPSEEPRPSNEPRAPEAPRRQRITRRTAAVSGPDQDILEAPIQVLKGIGPAKAEMLRARGLHTLGDLLYVLPRGYQDRRKVLGLDELVAGSHTVAHGVVAVSGVIGKGRGSRFEVLLEDGRGRLKLIFFHFHSWDMRRRFSTGTRITVSGEVTTRGGTPQMVHPRVVSGEQTETLCGIWPIYPEIGGLHPAELGRWVKAAVDALAASPPREVLPATIRRRAKLPDLTEALRAIHVPEPDASEEEIRCLVEREAPAFRRLAFEELFVLQLAMGLRRRAALGEPAPALRGPDAASLADELLPFAPTGAQLRCAREICADLDRAEPMGRLLQGDVGAGKTAVAAMACLRAVRAGYQAAVMAPTELLAEQHKATFEKLMRPLGLRVMFVSGSVRGKRRRLAMARLKNHEVDVLVGTQALLSDDVEFAQLGLCVIDEQHRFGVVQRVALKQKGPRDADGRALAPHLLVMTATPIPRSLALTIHGDLAVSILDELPPGRTPVRTRVLVGDQEEEGWAEIAAALERDERAYVVYPLIEESEKMDLLDATRGYEDLAERFGTSRVGLLHGRMSAEDKEQVMGAFSRGEISVLVSTTVIEVGVDVPEATFMVVMHAERFGLSQLHQLRGRVGRGKAKSSCFLVVGSDGAGRDGKRRLAVLEESTDGFRISEEDLAIRGPGDFLGTRQSGLPTLIFSDFVKHAALIELARQLANEVLTTDPNLDDDVHVGLRMLVQKRFAERIALTGAG